MATLVKVVIPTTVAEITLDNGRRVQKFLKQGGTVPQFVFNERVEPHKVHFALAWANAVDKHPAMFLQAVFEEWSMHQIAEAISIPAQHAPAHAGACSDGLRPIFLDKHGFASTTSPTGVIGVAAVTVAVGVALLALLGLLLFFPKK